MRWMSHQSHEPVALAISPDFLPLWRLDASWGDTPCWSLVECESMDDRCRTVTGKRMSELRVCG